MATPSRLEALNTLRVANLDVAFATAFVTLFGGSLMVGFIQHLGGGDFAIGLLGAVPALMGLMQIPGAVLGRGAASFKKYVATGGFLWRLFFLPLVFLPLIPLPDNIRLAILLLCLGIAAFCQNFVNPIYNEWIGKIVPERARGWYFSQRTLIATFTGMVVGLIGARMLDVFKGQPNENIGFSIIFGLGWICAMVSMFFYYKMSDSTREEVVKPNFRNIVEVVREPLRDKNFRQIMYFVIIFTASQGFAGNLFSAFAFESLKLPFLYLQLTGVSFAIGTVATVRIWGFLADRYGNKPLLILMMIGLATGPLQWILCIPDPDYIQTNTAILFIGHIFTGIFWSGVGVTQMNLYLATSTPQNRANYLASALTIAAISMGISPLLGSATLNILREPLGAANAYKVVFLIVGILRIVAIFLLRPVHEERSEGFSETIRQLTGVRPKSFTALRSIRKGSDESTREQAIRSMGESKMSLGTSELHEALYDPTPRVRREAAIALGRLRSLPAAQALLDHARAHPDLIEEETVEALGECGQPVAIPFLTESLQNPSSIIRRAAAKALGRIGDSSAIESLREAATQPGDPDIRRAALQALRSLAATDPTLYADALLEQHPSVRTAAAEAVSELRIADLAPNLRTSLDWYQDEALSEVAYALGTTGIPEDLPLILRAAQNAISDTKRRRCLLGAAKLFDLDREFYRFLALEEVSRDTELLRKFRPLSRRSPLFAEALEAYSSGDEPRALQILAQSKPDRFQDWATYPVPESFLIVASLFQSDLGRD